MQFHICVSDIAKIGFGCFGMGDDGCEAFASGRWGGCG